MIIVTSSKSLAYGSIRGSGSFKKELLKVTTVSI